MRKYLLPLIVLALLPFFGNAQTTHLSEDFSTAADSTTPPSGWTQNIITGDPTFDLWRFNNPGGRALNAPISDPAAIFDSDEKSQNGGAEDVALESPVIDLTNFAVVKLEFDHYFQGGFDGASFVEVFDGTNWIEVLKDTLASTPNPESVSIDVSNEIGGVANAQVRFRWTGNFSWYWIVDNVVLFTPSPDDIGITAITSPVTGYGLTASESVTVTIENFGTSTQSGFPLGYAVNGVLPPVIELYSGPAIPPGGTGTHTFATGADLSNPGTYLIQAATGLLTDADLTNDTSAVTVESLVPFPITYTQDFETTSGLTLPALWVNDPGFLAWRGDNGGTTSSDTGPAVDHTLGTSAGIYLYTETSSPTSQGDTFQVTSPGVDLAGATTPTLDFWYHMAGAAIGTLEVDIIDGGVATTVWSLSGPQQSSETDAWLRARVSLSAYLNKVVQVRFRGIAGPIPPSTANVFEGDIAIDDVVLFDLPAIDMRAVSIDSPVGAGCFGSAETVAVTLENDGSATIDFAATPLTVTANITGPVAGSFNATVNTGTLAPGTTTSVTVTTAANLSAPGTYAISAYGTVAGDGNVANDTTASTVTTLPILAGTFLQDFESYPTGISASFPDGWFNDQNDDEEWTVDAGGTPSGSTGPSVDHTTGTSTGQYIYAETSTWGTGESGIFVSPCLDVSSMNFPGLEFWYHMYGAAMGTLEVGVRVNGVDTVLWSISGQQQGSSGAPWERGAIDLIPYKSQSFQVFFKGTDGSSITGDMALDDIGTFEQPAVDMGVAAVLSPVGASCFGATETLEVTIVNDGLAPIDFAANNAQLDATIAGPNAAAYSITVSSGTLDVDSSLNVVISSAVDLSQVGQNDYTVSITVAGDGGAFNDTLLASSTTIPTIAAPFLEDFESLSNGTPAGDIGNGWINSADDDSDWTIDNGGTGSSNTGPDVDHTTGSSSGKYLYIETSSGSDGDTYDLISPCIDLSGATVPVLSFWYHMAGAHINMLEVYIVDGGTETLVWSQAGAVQSGTAAPWEEGTVSLVGQPSTIQLLFRGYKGTSFEGDIAIDDVGVEDLAGITDLGLSIDAPEDGAVICADTTGALTLTVTNAGGDSVDFAVDTTTIVVNGATSSTTVELNAGKIGFGQSITVSSSIDISMAGNYSYTAYLSGLAADTTNGNDTASATFDVLPAVASLPYVEDFSAGSGGWISGGANSSWAFGVPAGATIDTAASDTNAWVTNLGGDYNPNEQSFVVGPCFDLSNAAADTRIAMSIWVDSESSWDGTVLQASTDDGVTWNNVGALNDPINWYNDGDIDGLPGGSLVGWSGASGGWVRAEHGLDTSLIGQSSVIFRVAFGSDGSFQFEGFAFDDVVVGEAPVVDLGGDSLTVCIGEMLDAGVTPGATYAWSTGASTSMIALTNNTGAFIIDSVISVTVTDTLGFATSASVVVSIAPSLPTVAANITQDINCNGDSTGMISAAVSGANGTVAYSWDTNPVQTTPMLMGLPAGDYTVTITDSAGCTATASANLTEPTALGVGVDSIMGVNCPSDSMGSIEISVSGGTAPYSFVWSNGDTTEDISGLPAGDYTGTITDSLGCVLVSPALNVPSTNNDPVASFDLEQVGGTVNLVSTSTDADSIAWDLGDGVGTSGDDTLSYAYASNDTFVVTLTVFNECGSSSVSDTVFMTQVGLEDELVREINIYPNPSQGQFEVSFGNLNLEEVSLTVVTMAGQLVHAVEVGNVFANHREEITLPSSVAAGVYLLQIRTEETVVYKRLSIEK